MPANTTVLIPAAGRVPEGLLAMSNIACPAMIPVAGRPVIHWTLSYLLELGFQRFVIAVGERGLFVEDFVDAAFGDRCEVTFITAAREGGVGRTVLELVESCHQGAALVVLGDTHFSFADPGVVEGDEPFVLTSPVEESYRWCVAEADADGFIARLRDKEPGLQGPLDALIGVYFFPDTDCLRRAAHDAVVQSTEEGRSPQLSDIIRRVHDETPVRVVPAGEWLDCGNPDRQAQSHRALLQARAFNELQVNSVFGTVTKRSVDKEKFINEINYLRLLPPEMAVLFPRVVAYSTAWEDPWLESEYYGYPTLADVFLFENVDPAIWQRVFAHLGEIIGSGFRRFAHPLPPGVVTEMYVDKTKRRLERMRCSETLAALVESGAPIVVNGRPLENLPSLWPRIEAAVAALEGSAEGSIVHGDLCLSNVLYDLRGRVCKLIDPRGSFGRVGIYGDPRYDVAKLWHSVHGLYDFIVNDLFRINLDDGHVELSIRTGPSHREIEERFTRVFFSEAEHRRDEILLISALQFASMPALHYDAPRRQVAMYIRALQLFDEYFSQAPS